MSHTYPVADNSNFLLPATLQGKETTQKCYQLWHITNIQKAERRLNHRLSLQGSILS